MEDYLFIRATNAQTGKYFTCVIYQENVGHILYANDNQLYHLIQKQLSDFTWVNISPIDGIFGSRFTSLFGAYCFGDENFYNKIAEVVRKSAVKYFQDNPGQAQDDYADQGEEYDDEDEEEEDGP